MLWMLLTLALAQTAPAESDPPVKLANGVTMTLGKGQTSVLEGIGAYNEGDYAKAESAFRKAAEQGNVDGMRNLGNLFETGHNQAGRVDLAKAMHWYMQAAEAGNGYAFHKAAALHYRGDGVPKDRAKAYALEQRGAALGDPACQHQVGFMLKLGHGTQADPPAATPWFRKAADQGNSDSMVSLGIAYLEGIGVDKDPATAKVWFEKAAEDGQTMAMKAMSQLYLNGLGVDKDQGAAIGWLQKAARAGDAEAQALLKKNNIPW